jgi:thiamine kinase-like enzyme
LNGSKTKMAKQRGVALQRICDELDSPVVFSHNDLLSGNFMCDNKTGQSVSSFEVSMTEDYDTLHARGFPAKLSVIAFMMRI